MVNPILEMREQRLRVNARACPRRSKGRGALSFGGLSLLASGNLVKRYTEALLPPLSNLT